MLLPILGKELRTPRGKELCKSSNKPLRLMNIVFIKLKLGFLQQNYFPKLSYVWNSFMPNCDFIQHKTPFP
jgi:hypothetical protein